MEELQLDDGRAVNFFELVSQQGQPLDVGRGPEGQRQAPFGLGGVGRVEGEDMRQDDGLGLGMGG